MSWQDIRIETDRLILRPPRRDDFDAWAANMANEDVGPLHRWRAAACRRLAWFPHHGWRLGHPGLWHVLGD